MALRNDIFERIAWWIVLFILFGQSILGRFSFLSNVALGYIAIRNYYLYPFYNNWYRFYIGAFLLIMGYSFALGNSPLLVVRFALILFFIFFSYIWKVDYKIFFKYLVFFSAILVVGLICLEIFLLFSSMAEYEILRGFVIQNNMGDVFFYHLYYKLELRGTPLVVFVYMLSYVIDIFPTKYVKTFRLFYFVGIIFAGNFAYQLALLLFHIIKYVYEMIQNPSSRFRKIVFLFFMLILLGGVLTDFVSNTMEEKADISNATRIDQAKVLIEDMSRNVVTLVFGSGLGHTIEVETEFRDYHGNIYYELQSLYMMNQLGLLGFTLFFAVNLVLAFRCITYPRLLFVYGIYLLYACTNPYIWDTNHIIVIVSLLCAKSKIDNKRLRNEEGHLCLSSI